MMWCATRLNGELPKACDERAWLRTAMIAALAVQAAVGSVAYAVESQAPVHTVTAGTLDHRVAVLSKALDLDARQRSELWKIFASQREAVKEIWRDPALLAAERAPATRAVEDRTADAIRAILTDEQKKKYNPPKPATPPSGPLDVGAWMDAARAK
jgi:Spy/CpxP family protein refolding chaperone